ncbi:MAG: DUF1592 domain-containing protein [Myxococcota bacterium]
MPLRWPAPQVGLFGFGLAMGCGQVSTWSDPPLRRLTPTEYNHTIRDLFGFSIDEPWPDVEGFDDNDGQAAWPWRFPADIPIHGFEGIAEGQVASSYLIEQYQAAADHFSQFALAAPAFWTCEDRPACAEDSVVRFAHRAWRRPLTTNEQARITAFHQTAVAEQGVDDGTRLAVMGILQAPQFLYRVEDADSRDAFALASRLSYLLWDSMPDPELFEAAATGKLQTKAHVTKQVRRMLAHPKARTAIVAFHEQWLGIDEVYSNRAARQAYAPAYLPEIVGASQGGLANESVEEVWSSYLVGAQAAMVREAQLFLERTVFEGPGTLGTLLTDHHGYATRLRGLGDNDTFRLYGVTAGDALPLEVIHESLDDGNLTYDFTYVPVTFPVDQRSGVLTLGATLAARAHPVHPAPVLRGVFVLERLACENMGQPPDGAALEAPPDAVSASSTNRERLDAITNAAPCASCHDRINPLGYAFENYDSLGGWREVDNGSAVDASGVLRLTGEPEVPFNDAVELGRALARSDRVHDCYAEQWMRYAFGTDISSSDPTLLEVQHRFKNRHKGRVLDLIVDIATSDAFRKPPASGEGNP